MPSIIYHIDMMRQLLSLGFLLIIRASSTQALSGITGTDTGYDNVYGTDAICWESYSHDNYNKNYTIKSQIDSLNLVADRNGGIQSFWKILQSTPVGRTRFSVEGLSEQTLENGTNKAGVNLLYSCPNQTWLKISPPSQYPEGEIGEGPLTFREYNYTVEGQINLAELEGSQIVSDTGTPRVRIEAIACKVSAAFCSPYVHDQTVRHTQEEKATVYGDSHGDTHVDSKRIFIDLEPSESQLYTFQAEVPLRINESGDYSIIGVLKFFTGNSSSLPQVRYDIANSLSEGGNWVVINDEPDISYVGDTARIIVYTFIGLASFVLIVLIVLTIKYYNNQVMQISQAPFLLAYEFAALMAVVCCIFVEPKNDVYCNWGISLIIIPIHLHNAITLGRLYRIHAVVSPLLSDHFSRVGSAPKVLEWLKLRVLSILLHCKVRPMGGSKQIRKTVSQRQVVKIVIGWTLPQVILNIFRLVYQPNFLVYDLEDDFSGGRAACSAQFVSKDEDIWSSLAFYSSLFLVLLASMVLVMAYISRNLPSLLNESRAIYGAVIPGICTVTLVGISLALTSSPSSSPGLRFVMITFAVLVLVMTPTVRIVCPKLFMASQGQKVMLHEMISEHNKQNRPPSNQTTSRTSTLIPGSCNVHVTGITPTLSQQSSDVARIASTTPTIDSVPEGALVETADYKSNEETEAGTPKMRALWAKNSRNAFSQCLGVSRSILTIDDVLDPADRIYVREGAVPPSEVVTPMIDLQDQINRIRNKIGYGMAVSEEDWQKVSMLAVDFESVTSLLTFKPEDSVEDA